MCDISQTGFTILKKSWTENDRYSNNQRGQYPEWFCLDFLKKRIKEGGRESLALVAADSGMEWFMRNREFIPDLAVGDFDSLSEEGKKIHGKSEWT